MSKEAVRTTKNIRARLSQAQAVAEAVKSAANRPLLVSLHIPIRSSKPKIDLAHISKPGDVLKAIQETKRIKQDNASGTLAVPASVAPNFDSVRDAVVHALLVAGHESAALLLRNGTWTFDGLSFRVEVAGMGKKMIALTVNAAAEKVIRQELLRQGAPTRILVASIERTEKTAKPIPTLDQMEGTSTEVK